MIAKYRIVDGITAIAQALLGENARSLTDAAGRFFIASNSKNGVTYKPVPGGSLEQGEIMALAKHNALFVSDKDNALRQIKLVSDAENTTANLQVSEPFRAVKPPRPSFYLLKNLLSFIVKSFRDEIQEYQEKLEFFDRHGGLAKHGIDLNPGGKQSSKEAPVVQEPEVQEPVVQNPVVQNPVVQEPVVQESKAQKQPEKNTVTKVLIEDDEVKPEVQMPKVKKPKASVERTIPKWQQQSKAQDDESLHFSKMSVKEFKAYLDTVNGYQNDNLIAGAMSNKKCTPKEIYEAAEKMLEWQLARNLLESAGKLQEGPKRDDFLDGQKQIYGAMATELRKFVRERIDEHLINEFCRNHDALSAEGDALLDAADGLAEIDVSKQLNVKWQPVAKQSKGKKIEKKVAKVRSDDDKVKSEAPKRPKKTVVKEEEIRNPSKMTAERFKAHLETINRYNDENLVVSVMAKEKCTPEEFYEAMAMTLEAQVAKGLLDEANNIPEGRQRNGFLDKQKQTYASLAVGLRGFVKERIDEGLVNRFCRKHDRQDDESMSLLDAAEELALTGVNEYKIQLQNAADQGAQQTMNQAQKQSQQLQQSPPKLTGPGM